jgi:hypothetical protein
MFGPDNLSTQPAQNVFQVRVDGGAALANTNRETLQLGVRGPCVMCVFLCLSVCLCVCVCKFVFVCVVRKSCKMNSLASLTNGNVECGYLLQLAT